MLDKLELDRLPKLSRNFLPFFNLGRPTGMRRCTLIGVTRRYEGDPVVSPGAMGVLVGVGVSSGQRRRRG